MTRVKLVWYSELHSIPLGNVDPDCRRVSDYLLDIGINATTFPSLSTSILVEER